MAQRRPLSQVLPPLVLGTATFNTQYHDDPTHMPYVDIVRRALENDVAAFDTSPYYGPAETLLGDALAALDPPPPRGAYMLMTKAGRVAADEFDYSPAWVRYSVCRSLERLGTDYLDVVYAHDVEFVAPRDVLAAVVELRRLRDRGRLRYVGISGYPVGVLARLAAMVLEQTGEPLDAVLSYGHFCLQNTQLGRPDVLDRFRAAGVDCLLNASMLGMGLLTSRGVDNGPMASWHPAPPALRDACAALAAAAARRGERLEEVAIRWALHNWARVGAPLGSRALRHAAPVGVSVMGVAAVDELDETLALWRGALGPADDAVAALVAGSIWPALGPWKDFAWESGGDAFTNRREAPGAVPDDDVAERWGLTSETVLDSAKI